MISRSWDWRNKGPIAPLTSAGENNQPLTLLPYLLDLCLLYCSLCVGANRTRFIDSLGSVGISCKPFNLFQPYLHTYIIRSTAVNIFSAKCFSGNCYGWENTKEPAPFHPPLWLPVPSPSFTSLGPVQAIGTYPYCKAQGFSPRLLKVGSVAS